MTCPALGGTPTIGGVSNFIVGLDTGTRALAARLVVCFVCGDGAPWAGSRGARPSRAAPGSEAHPRGMVGVDE